MLIWRWLQRKTAKAAISAVPIHEACAAASNECSNESSHAIFPDRTARLVGVSTAPGAITLTPVDLLGSWDIRLKLKTVKIGTAQRNYDLGFIMISSFRTSL